MTKGGVIVETRDTGVEDIIHNHYRFLSNDWGLTFFGSKHNEEIVKSYYPEVSFVLMTESMCSGFNANKYNELLTSLGFWNTISYDKVLIFQHDSQLLRHGIEDFLEYDYIGAPLYHISFPAMNGGLSIRSKDVMIKAILKEKYHAPSHGNEDIYFCKVLKEIGAILPTKEEAMKFSVETVFYPEPIGVHAPERYLSKKELYVLYGNI